MTLLTREEGRSLLAKKKRANKYNAQKVTVDGITFDSKAEARFYSELKILEAAGLVANVQLQVPFLLQATNGQVVGIYRADYAFDDLREKRHRIVDVKGMDTKLSAWKRRHVKAQYGIEVEVVR